MITCIECGIKVNNGNPRWLLIPGHIIVPNQYYLCDKHKDIQINFEDIYNEDGTRKKKMNIGNKQNETNSL